MEAGPTDVQPSPDTHAGALGVLCLDIEGGWGGSSRSLYYLIEAMDRTRLHPVILVRKDGPIRSRYDRIGVTCVHMPELPTFRPAERNNLFSFLLFVWDLRRLPRIYDRIKQLVKDHDVSVLHVNHESLALTGYLLSSLLGLPWIAHIRTTLIPGWFARRLCRLIVAKSAQVICIVEPVKGHLLRLTGASVESGSKVSVVHNIVPRLDAPLPAPAVFSNPPDRFRVLSLTNFSPNRGVDRIVEVAEVLHRRGDGRFAFYLCGRPANTHAITGRTSPYYASIRARVAEYGLKDMVFFPGHVSDPERALFGCDALIKLTRQSNPWGRDVMEALVAGLPVVTLGTFQGFVENNVNGYLAEEYRPEEIADYLQTLAADPALRTEIAAANKAKAEHLFSAQACAQAVEMIYRRAASAGLGADEAAEPRTRMPAA